MKSLHLYNSIYLGITATDQFKSIVLFTGYCMVTVPGQMLWPSQEFVPGNVIVREALEAFALRCFSEMLCSFNRREISSEKLSDHFSLIQHQHFSASVPHSRTCAFLSFSVSERVPFLRGLSLEMLCLFRYRQGLFLLPLQLFNACLQRRNRIMCDRKC